MGFLFYLIFCFFSKWQITQIYAWLMCLFNVMSLNANSDLDTKKPPIWEAFLFVLAQQQKFVVETSGI